MNSCLLMEKKCKEISITQPNHQLHSHQFPSKKFQYQKKSRNENWLLDQILAFEQLIDLSLF